MFFPALYLVCMKQNIVHMYMNSKQWNDVPMDVKTPQQRGDFKKKYKNIYEQDEKL